MQKMRHFHIYLGRKYDLTWLYFYLLGLGLFHVTLCMLRLDGQEGSDEMIQVFKEAQPQLQELSRNLKLRIKGLSTFGQRVLYAKALPDPDETFWQFVRYVLVVLKKSQV